MTPPGSSFFEGYFDEQAMGHFAATLAPALRCGDCLAFYGDLGAGKTSFARALIKALTDETEVPSPTFTLVQSYDSRIGSIWHMDLYRLKRAEELVELGFAEAVGHALLLIEWPERAGNLLPLEHLAIGLQFAQHGDARALTLKGSPAWQARLLPILTPLQKTPMTA